MNLGPAAGVSGEGYSETSSYQSEQHGDERA